MRISKLSVVSEDRGSGRSSRDEPTKVENVQTFGSRLRQLMLASGLNQTRLASKSGIDRSIVNRLISGKARPQAAQIGWLAQVLGVDVDELMVGVELPDDVRRTTEHVRTLGERVLRAETERDQATTRSERLATELSRERSQHEQARARIEQLEASEARLRRQLAKPSTSPSPSSSGSSLQGDDRPSLSARRRERM